jgi:hypothetical protein
MGLMQLVGAVRKIEKAMGDGKIYISNKEVPIAQKIRAHIPALVEASNFEQKFVKINENTVSYI